MADNEIWIKIIEPCPERFKWNKAPDDRLAKYLECNAYGYVCIEQHPYLNLCFFHGSAYEDKKPELHRMITAFKLLEDVLRKAGVKLFAIKFKAMPAKALAKLIVTRLDFADIGNNIFLKIL